MSDFGEEDYEIEKLFKEIDQGQQDEGFGNHDDALFPISQVPLFSPVVSPTEIPADGVPSVTLEERGRGGTADWGRAQPGP